MWSIAKAEVALLGARQEAEEEAPKGATATAAHDMPNPNTENTSGALEFEGKDKSKSKAYVEWKDIYM